MFMIKKELILTKIVTCFIKKEKQKNSTEVKNHQDFKIYSKIHSFKTQANNRN